MTRGSTAGRTPTDLTAKLHLVQGTEYQLQHTGSQDGGRLYFSEQDDGVAVDPATPAHFVLPGLTLAVLPVAGRTIWIWADADEVPFVLTEAAT